MWKKTLSEGTLEVKVISSNDIYSEPSFIIRDLSSSSYDPSDVWLTESEARFVVKALQELLNPTSNPPVDQL